MCYESSGRSRSNKIVSKPSENGSLEGKRIVGRVVPRRPREMTTLRDNDDINDLASHCLPASDCQQPRPHREAAMTRRLRCVGNSCWLLGEEEGGGREEEGEEARRGREKGVHLGSFIQSEDRQISPTDRGRQVHTGLR